MREANPRSAKSDFFGFFQVIFQNPGGQRDLGILSSALSPVQGQESNGITAMKAKHQLDASVADLTPTLCDLCGVPRPNVCAAEALPAVIERAKEALGERSVTKALIFCPDAIGNVQLEKWPEEFAPLLAVTDVTVKGTNVLPSVTPVCFATIFTGAPPEVHGIIKYARPVLKVETLFDVFAKAGRKVAIVAENNCSIDLIFRERSIDYFSFPENEASFNFGKHLLAYFDYDLILVYDGGYESTMHKNGVWHEQSLEALRDSIRRYAGLVQCVDEHWKNFDRLTVFAPDHGSHDNEKGKGSHGSDSPEDAVFNHYYRVRPAE